MQTNTYPLLILYKDVFFVQDCSWGACLSFIGKASCMQTISSIIKYANVEANNVYPLTSFYIKHIQFYSFLSPFQFTYSLTNSLFFTSTKKTLDIIWYCLPMNIIRAHFSLFNNSFLVQFFHKHLVFSVMRVS